MIAQHEERAHKDPDALLLINYGYCSNYGLMFRAGVAGFTFSYTKSKKL